MNDAGKCPKCGSLALLQMAITEQSIKGKMTKVHMGYFIECESEECTCRSETFKTAKAATDAWNAQING